MKLEEKDMQVKLVKSRELETGILLTAYMKHSHVDFYSWCTTPFDRQSPGRP
jgi:hypothetical protein